MRAIWFSSDLMYWVLRFRVCNMEHGLEFKTANWHGHQLFQKSQRHAKSATMNEKKN